MPRRELYVKRYFSRNNKRLVYAKCTAISKKLVFIADDKFYLSKCAYKTKSNGSTVCNLIQWLTIFLFL